jgi:DNA polymerase-3 subunit epsilon
MQFGADGKNNFTAFDFEEATNDHFPCQLGLAVVRGGKIVDEKEYLIQPPANRYDSNKINVHGIRPQDTEKVSDFKTLWPQIKPFFDGELMIGHNVNSDTNMLKRACSFYGLEAARPLAYYCTMELFGRQALKAVTQALGITMQRHHAALSDARACAEIFLAYLNGRNPEELTYQPKPKRKKTSGMPEDIIYRGHLSADEKRRDLSGVIYRDTPFYNQTIVLSGIFSRYPDRRQLELLLDSYGAFMRTNISKHTTMLITGTDYSPNKEESVKHLEAQGIVVSILREMELYEILDRIQHLNSII